jgi:hypothetical protein
MGGNNTATGYAAAFSDTKGSANTADGRQALYNNITGNGNTAIGYGALDTQTSGDFNTAVGLFAGNGITTAGNVICIGTSGVNVSDSCFIGNICNQFGGSQAVYVNSDGKLGAQVSSRRFKEHIRPMDKASDALLALKPVTFHYKKEIDPAGTSQFGLVAEDVDKINPDLVVHDKEGKPYSVRYDQVKAMLLNEFLKEHRKVEEQEATIAKLKRETETVVARLKDQESKIQRVSDQVQMNKPDPRVVASGR